MTDTNHAYEVGGRGRDSLGAVDETRQAVSQVLHKGRPPQARRTVRGVHEYWTFDGLSKPLPIVVTSCRHWDTESSYVVLVEESTCKAQVREPYDGAKAGRRNPNHTDSASDQPTAACSQRNSEHGKYLHPTCITV